MATSVRSARSGEWQTQHGRRGRNHQRSRSPFVTDNVDNTNRYHSLGPSDEEADLPEYGEYKDDQLAELLAKVNKLHANREKDNADLKASFTAVATTLQRHERTIQVQAEQIKALQDTAQAQQRVIAQQYRRQTQKDIQPIKLNVTIRPHQGFRGPFVQLAPADVVEVLGLRSESDVADIVSATHTLAVVRCRSEAVKRQVLRKATRDKASNQFHVTVGDDLTYGERQDKQTLKPHMQAIYDSGRNPTWDRATIVWADGRIWHRLDIMDFVGVPLIQAEILKRCTALESAVPPPDVHMDDVPQPEVVQPQRTWTRAARAATPPRDPRAAKRPTTVSSPTRAAGQGTYAQAVRSPPPSPPNTRQVPHASRTSAQQLPRGPSAANPSARPGARAVEASAAGPSTGPASTSAQRGRPLPPPPPGPPHPASQHSRRAGQVFAAYRQSN